MLTSVDLFACPHFTSSVRGIRMLKRSPLPQRGKGAGRCGLKPLLRSCKPLRGFHVLSKGFSPQLIERVTWQPGFTGSNSFITG